MTRITSLSAAESTPASPAAPVEKLANVPFIVGSERSGTTLLRIMLDHHPQLAFGNEFEFSVQRIGADGSWPELADYYEWLESNRIFLSSRYAIDRRLSYPDLINSFLCQERDRAGKGRVGATVHHHFDRLLHIWPDAKLIHLIRDGRDVARSCIEMGWAGNAWTGVQRWIDAELLWESLSKRLPANQQITITYEALVREPQSTLIRLCEFIGLPYDPAMLDYTKDSSYEAPNPKFLEQWRRKLSEQDVRLVESRIGEMLVARGYMHSGLPKLDVTPKMEKKLRRQDRIARRKFRMKRYGLRLFTADFISRSLGMRGWQKRVRLRTNAEDAKYLK